MHLAIMFSSRYMIYIRTINTGKQMLLENVKQLPSVERGVPLLDVKWEGCEFSFTQMKAKKLNRGNLNATKCEAVRTVRSAVWRDLEELDREICDVGFPGRWNGSSYR